MAASPVELDAARIDVAPWLRPGDGVVVGNLAAEPVGLVEAAWRAAGEAGDVSVFLGMSLHDHAPLVPAGVHVRSYGGLGRTGRIEGLEIVPCHYSALPRLFAERLVPADVVLVQVTPPGADGRCGYAGGTDYLPDAITHARVVVGEVNAAAPRVGGETIALDRFDAVVHTDRPLPELRTEPGPVERAIAGHVAALVRDGDTLQMGVGALPDAILAALAERRELGVHSGMVSDGFVDLLDSGALSRTTVTGQIVGTQRLYDAVDGRDDIDLRTVSHTHSAATLARVGRLVAINSAIEVDLDGNAGCESVGGRAVGAIGGQVDFLRAAAASGGVGIVALPAAHVVERLDGPVSTTRADVDVVVTEHGARRLTGLTARERRRALSEIADPRTTEEKP